jgi:ribosomal protein L7Ae-like RNA K-turn-binding protein
MSRGTTAADAALHLLGLARRAGAVAAGTQRTREALRAGLAKLVLVAGDAAEPQRRKVEVIASRRGVPRVVVADRVGLGSAVGEPPLSAVAVTEAGFAQRLLQLVGDVSEEA